MPLVPSHIPTPPGQVVHTLLRPLPQMYWEAIDKEVEMLQLGVVVPFRKVNCIAKFAAYPMPCMDVLLEWLGYAKILSELDLTKGYWRVTVAAEDQKMAFTTLRRLFHFMPLGWVGRGQASPFTSFRVS